MESEVTSAKEAPVTNYYLWLPYMMSLIFLITKLPHILWKRFFENNMIRHLLGGEESWQDLFVGGGDGNGNGNNGNENSGKKGGGENGNNNNQQGQGEGKKGKKKGNQGKRFKVWKSSEIGKHFVESHKKFTKYQWKYAFWETLNIVSILACMQITDWILNFQFWSYGLKVIHYLKEYQDRSVPLHDPMCQVFPTEVSCYVASGGDAGHVNYQVSLGLGTGSVLMSPHCALLELALYSGEQHLQSEVLLCPLALVDGSPGHFSCRSHLPPVENHLPSLL